MNEKVVTVRAGTTLREAARLLEEERVHGVPVLDAAKNVVGVLSGTDLAGALTAEVDPRAPRPEGSVDWLEAEAAPLVDADPDETVENVMTTRIVHAAPDATVGAIARLMGREKVHRVLITEGKTLRGIVSATDLLDCLVKYEKALES
ncbi:MAG: CBS domain-containing protein [Planctomycetota bacterium JB042]